MGREFNGVLIMAFCPKHIENSVIPANVRFGELADEFHHYFQVICSSCGGTRFRVRVGNKKTVKGRCDKCGSEVLLYDLALYPAAIKPRGDEAFSDLDDTKSIALPLYVGYEYGELDDDQEFDQNDITWFEVFVENGEAMIKVFDDETA